MYKDFLYWQSLACFFLIFFTFFLAFFLCRTWLEEVLKMTCNLDEDDGLF